MKVAVVLTEIGGGAGGRFTFQETLAQTISELDAESRHEFVFYSRGLSRHTEQSKRWWLRRGRQVAGTRAVQATRDLQDRVMGKRLLHLRTSLDRQLEKDEVELVWFPTTYVEDCQLPYICTIFDLEHVRQPWFPEVSERGEWERREWTLGRSLSKATRVIVPNEAGRSQLERYYGIDRARTLCLPHPTPQFVISAASRPQQPASVLEREQIESPYLFYPAQYWPHKNHVTLMKALRHLRDAGTQHSVVCVGRDHGTLAHIKFVERALGLQDAVHHLGFVSEDDLVSLYQHADALVYPTLFGPENLPPLEAFALGCPVVCSDVDGARDQVGSAALVVPAMDPEAIADAVQSLSDHGTRSELIAAGRERAAERSAAAYVGGVVRFLDEFEATLRSWQ